MSIESNRILQNPTGECILQVGTDSYSIVQMILEPCKDPTEPDRILQNPTDEHRILQDHTEPYRIRQNHADEHRVLQDPAESHR